MVTGNRIRICVNIPLAPEDLWKDFGGVDWQPQYDLADMHGIKEWIQSKKENIHVIYFSESRVLTENFFSQSFYVNFFSKSRLPPYVISTSEFLFQIERCEKLF